MNIQIVLALIDERIQDAEILKRRSSPNSNESARAYYTLDVLKNLRRDIERRHLRETEDERRQRSRDLYHRFQREKILEVRRLIEEVPD